jgi:hypothetical protein
MPLTRFSLRLPRKTFRKIVSSNAGSRLASDALGRT